MAREVELRGAEELIDVLDLARDGWDDLSTATPVANNDDILVLDNDIMPPLRRVHYGSDEGVNAWYHTWSWVDEIANSRDENVAFLLELLACEDVTEFDQPCIGFFLPNAFVPAGVQLNVLVDLESMRDVFEVRKDLVVIGEKFGKV